MTARRTTAGAFALAAAVALVAVPARADDEAVDRRPRAFLAIDALGANGPERPDVAAGVRLSAGVRRPRLQILGSVEALGPLGAPARQPRLGGFALAGAGIGYAPVADPRFLVHGSISLGAHRIQVRDYIEGGWNDVTWFAFAPRVGVSYRLGGQPPGGTTVAVIGASVTELYTTPHDDLLRRISTGGPTTLVMLSVGAEWSPSR